MDDYEAADASVNESYYGDYRGNEFPQDGFHDAQIDPYRSSQADDQPEEEENMEEHTEKNDIGVDYQPPGGQESYHRHRFVNQGEEGDDNYREAEGRGADGQDTWIRGVARLKPGETHSVNVGFGQFLTKMNRECWGAAKPLPRPNIFSPVTKIRLTHTGTPQCYNKEECIAAVQNIQTYYMDLGFPDIPYNFLIGGDGILYHGRGWLKQADRSYHYRNLRRSCIDVAYIGDFQYERLPPNMSCVATDFLKYGLKTQRISPFYQVYSFLDRNPMPLARFPLVSRTEWGAHDARYWTSLKTPVRTVRFTSTGTGHCPDRQAGLKLVSQLQEAYMDTGFCDIPHSFLIGGDGTVYEGRGWTIETELPELFRDIQSDCIDIAYFGDFSESDPPWEMQNTGIDLIMLGLQMRNIYPDFKIIPHRRKKLKLKSK